MYAYAILILLPALALAQVDHDALENKLFSAIDANDDGSITQAETEAYFQTYDTDKNGQVSKAEFSAAVDKLDPAFASHEDALFLLLDRDGNGYVNNADVDTLFKIVDIDDSNAIVKIEFHIVFNLVVSHVES